MMDIKSNRRQAGFTLVEIMVVVVILGLLATVGTIGVRRFLIQGKEGVAKTKCAELEQAVRSEEMHTPLDNAEMIWDHLVEVKILKRREDLKDPWGVEFAVRRDEDNEYIVISAGPDKQFDTEDDIGSRGKITESQGF